MRRTLDPSPPMRCWIPSARCSAEERAQVDANVAASGLTAGAYAVLMLTRGPELVAALRALVSDFGGISGGCESLDVARALLSQVAPHAGAEEVRS